MHKLPLKAEHLKKLKACGLQDVPPDRCECLSFEPGEFITREGEPISRFVIVMEGRAKACRTAANGNSLILCYYISGGMIGEIELLTKQNIAGTTVTAITKFECIAIHYQDCQIELKKNPEFLRILGTVLARKLEDSSENLATSALCTGEQRLCSYILQNSNNDRFHDVLSDVCCSIGISYRHLFRLLNELCNEDILRKLESGYQILDYSRLKQRSAI